MANRHSVKPGDRIASIGHANGHFEDTLWDHPENAGLREAREDHNVLLPDVDTVFVPDIEAKEESRPSDKRHRFRRKGVPEQFRLRLLNEDNEPREGLTYRLDLDGDERQGETDGNGELFEWIPVGTQSGELVIDPDGEPEHYQLEIGHLDPADDHQGLRDRMINLGVLDDDAEEETEQEDPLHEALLGLQREEGLPESGVADEATLDSLLALHRS